ncbi:hypothetical protein [Myroides odoratus]|uniref:hypothetical protein n=1 Tax=Myroides odoratus TaxID=256 RepID=UPI00333FAA4D
MWFIEMEGEWQIESVAGVFQKYLLHLEYKLTAKKNTTHGNKITELAIKEMSV